MPQVKSTQEDGDFPNFLFYITLEAHIFLILDKQEIIDSPPNVLIFGTPSPPGKSTEHKKLHTVLGVRGASLKATCSLKGPPKLRMQLFLLLAKPCVLL